MEDEEKVWEILLSADKKDYEKICAEYGITDFRGMLKKLTEMKREREQEIASVSRLFGSFLFFLFQSKPPSVSFCVSVTVSSVLVSRLQAGLNDDQYLQLFTAS